MFIQFIVHLNLAETKVVKILQLKVLPKKDFSRRVTTCQLNAIIIIQCPWRFIFN